MADTGVQPRPTPAGELLYAVEEQTTIRLEERDGIAKLVTLRSNGLDIGLFHVLTIT